MSVESAVKNEMQIHSIIVADDDSDDRLFLEDVLREIAPTKSVTSVKDGQELLSLFTHFVPDFLFLDLEMPRKNGLECLKEIRNNPDTKDLPIVVFSSTNRDYNIDVAYEMGAHLFFSKPNSYDDLKLAMQNILSFDWSNPAAVTQQFCNNGSYLPFTITKSES
ncbi:MAG TPA: response regulator [Flavisolibacter sp.]|nr:response regulator [Flavisolibacter sp.]